MRVSVVHPSELEPVHIEQWHAFLTADPQLAHPFLTPEFARAAGTALKGSRVAVLEDSQGTAGFFAFDRGAGGVGRPIGHKLSDLQAVVHRRDLDWHARDLLRACRLSAWRFTHLHGSQTSALGRNDTVQVSHAAVMDLSGGFEAYLQQRRTASKSLVQSTLRKSRKLSREVGPLRFELHADDPRPLATLMHWKSLQYRRTGVWDVFGDRWAADLVRATFDGDGARFAGVLSTLHAGDQLVAAHYAIRAHGVLSSWFPAYDPRFARYSPGNVLFLALAEAASQDGIRLIDLGTGGEGYKARLRTGGTPRAQGWISTRSVTALAHSVAQRARRAVLSSSLRGPARAAIAQLRQLPLGSR